MSKLGYSIQACILQTGQAYSDLGELEAAEACLAKATEYATQLLSSCRGNGQPRSAEWLQSIVELFIDRARNAWLLSQQVHPVQTSAGGSPIQSVHSGWSAPPRISPFNLPMMATSCPHRRPWMFR